MAAGGTRYLGGIQLRRGRRSPGLESVDRPLGSAEHNPIINQTVGNEADFARHRRHALQAILVVADRFSG